jgi:hypothetical protein
MPLIGDHNAHEYTTAPVVDGVQMSFGRIPRDYLVDGFASGPYLTAFPSELIIPRSEWKERIQEKDAKKSWITNICDSVGSKVKDQNGTNYCWINAPTRCLEITRIMAGEPQVVLSPASAGGPIKGFSNVGGWGTEGIKWIAENGVCPVENWPANAISRQYYTADNKAVAMKYRIDSWWDLHPNSFDELVSCALQDIPVAIGLSWWSHEVTFTFAAIDKNGNVVGGIDNSWGTGWGDNGRGLLTESKSRPDDANAVRTAIPSKLVA